MKQCEQAFEQPCLGPSLAPAPVSRTSRSAGRSSASAVRTDAHPARVAAPEQLMFTRRVHDMVAQMLRRDRRGRRELRELADFVGVG